MNLVRAEIERLVARRFVQLMVVLLVFAFAVTVATTIAGSHQPSAQEITKAQAEADREQEATRDTYEECLVALEPGTPESFREQYPPDCDLLLERPVEATDFLTGVFVFKREIQPLAYFLITFLTLFGFLVGASYIGADLTSGGMTNLLLWRPQRLTVLGTKLGTLLVGTLALSVVATAAYIGVFWVVAEAAGVIGNLSGEFWSSLATTIGRGLTLTLLFTALGFAIATLGRHTAAALGVIAGYGVLWEAGGRVVMEIINVPKADLWFLSSYLGAWMNGELDLYDSSRVDCSDTFGYCQPTAYTLTWLPSMLVLLAVVGVVVAGAFAVFRRRDLA